MPTKIFFPYRLVVPDCRDLGSEHDGGEEREEQPHEDEEEEEDDGGWRGEGRAAVPLRAQTTGNSIMYNLPIPCIQAKKQVSIG